MSDYVKDLVNGFRKYKEENFTDDSIFDPPHTHSPNSPPVFHPNTASNNVLLKQGLTDKIKQDVLNQIPIKQRHKWFRSMSSSQALAQSVFGNLKVLNKLDCLNELNGDKGKPLFIYGSNCENVCLEFEVNYLGEPKPTSVDVFFKGDYRVAVECKLRELEVGPCSRPNLKPFSSNYNQDYCDGRYAVQRGRTESCSLSSIGVKYWQYIPQLFNWSVDIDYDPCPLCETYQLVRNILAACVTEDGKLCLEKGHAVLLYDARNPAFQPDGKGMAAWETVRAALKYPTLLQACTWQRVIAAMRSDSELEWLVDLLNKKYGL